MRGGAELILRANLAGISAPLFDGERTQKDVVMAAEISGVPVDLGREIAFDAAASLAKLCAETVRGALLRVTAP
jgi:hypothetical protein